MRPDRANSEKFGNFRAPNLAMTDALSGAGIKIWPAWMYTENRGLDKFGRDEQQCLPRS